jgi:hypothetical protein
MPPQPKILTKLTNTMLNELNYLSWVRVVKISLKSREKLRLVIRVIKKPSLSLVSWLVVSIEPHIAEMCTYQETTTKV